MAEFGEHRVVDAASVAVPFGLAMADEDEFHAHILPAGTDSGRRPSAHATRPTRRP